MLQIPFKIKLYLAHLCQLKFLKILRNLKKKYGKDIIKAPIHLSDGNKKQLINIFKKNKRRLGYI